MSAEDVVIAVSGRLVLQSIRGEDKELLRQWKNLNRERFFHREMITEEQQAAWFAGYQDRADDWMFLVIDHGEAVGCLGFRLRSDDIDVYNVIRGRRGSSAGAMHRALGVVIGEAVGRYPGLPVRVRVMADNPAIIWYGKCGFRTTEVCDGFVVMELIS